MSYFKFLHLSINYSVDVHKDSNLIIRYKYLCKWVNKSQLTTDVEQIASLIFENIELSLFYSFY
jgi:hypothetical protein